MKNVVTADETKYVLKYESLFISERGFTSSKKYAKTFTEKEALAKMNTLRQRRITVKLEPVQ